MNMLALPQAKTPVNPHASAAESEFVISMALAALSAPTLELARQALDALASMGFDPQLHAMPLHGASTCGPSTSYMELASRETPSPAPMARALIERGCSPNPAIKGPSPLLSRVEARDAAGAQFFVDAGADWLAPVSTSFGGEQAMAEWFLFDRPGPPFSEDLKAWNELWRQALSALVGSPRHWSRALQGAIESPWSFSRANRAMTALSHAGASMDAVAQTPSRVALEGQSLFDIAAWGSGSRATPLFLRARELFSSSWSRADRSCCLAAFCAGAWQRMERSASADGRFCREEESSAPDIAWVKAFADSSPTERFDVPMAMEQASLGWLAGAACHYQRTHPQTWRDMAWWCAAWALEAQARSLAWDVAAFAQEFARGAADAPARALPHAWSAEVERDATAVPATLERERIERAAQEFFGSIPHLALEAPLAVGRLRDAWTSRACRDWNESFNSQSFGGARPFPVEFLDQLAQHVEDATSRGLWEAPLHQRHFLSLERVALRAAALPGQNAHALAALESIALRMGPRSAPALSIARPRL